MFSFYEPCQGIGLLLCLIYFQFISVCYRGRNVCITAALRSPLLIAATLVNESNPPGAPRKARFIDFQNVVDVTSILSI